MKIKALCVAALLAGGLIGLAWAQQGPLAGPGPRQDEANRPPPPPPPPGPPGRPGMGGGPAPLLKLLDTDKDGQLSAAELANAGTALAALDKNKDGNVTPDEIREYVPQRPQPGDFIMELDANKDGFVTFEEFTARMKKPFETIDTNHDGKISREEAAVAPPPPQPGSAQGPFGPDGRMHRGPGGPHGFGGPGRPRGPAGFDDDRFDGPPRGPRGQRPGPPRDFGPDDGEGGRPFHGSMPPRGPRRPGRAMDWR